MGSWHEKHLGVKEVSAIQPKRGKQISVVLKHTWVNQFWIRCPTRHAKTCRRLARVVTQTRHEVAASEPQVVTGHHLPGTGHLGTVKVCPLTTISTTFSFIQSPPNSIKKQHFALLEYRSQQTFEYIFQNHNYSDLVEVQRSVCEAKNTGGTLTLSQAGLR